MAKPLAVVIMAAGKGTRMKNPAMAKVMFPIHGKPMIEHVVALSVRLRSEITVVVVGWQKESVIAHLASTGMPVTCIEQTPQLGTGHAVMQAEQPLHDFNGDVLVLSGDVPLLTYSTVNDLIEFHRECDGTASVLTANLPDPAGYGRVVRDNQGNVIAIVEHKDATEEQRMIREINSGIYVFDRLKLFQGLKQISPNNAQKEYYLTDVFGEFWKNKDKVCAFTARDFREIQGINTVEQLDEARKILEIRPQEGS